MNNYILYMGEDYKQVYSMTRGKSSGRNQNVALSLYQLATISSNSYISFSLGKYESFPCFDICPCFVHQGYEITVTVGREDDLCKVIVRFGVFHIFKLFVAGVA